MNNKKMVLLSALLFILVLAWLPADDKVAVLVDVLLQNAPGFSTALNDYIDEVEENFTNVDILTPVYDDFWSLDPMDDIRAGLQTTLSTYSDLVGVILIGEIPLPLYQSFYYNTEDENHPDNDTSYYYPVTLPYEDLCGEFSDNWTLDADSLKTYDANGDGYIDSWTMDISPTNDPLDIWVSIIRPTKEYYAYGSPAATYQAEDATLGSGGPTPCPAVTPDANCAGGEKVINIAGGRENYLEFDVDVDNSALYEVTIYYKDDIQTFGQVSVNGKPAETVVFPKTGDTPETISLPDYLESSPTNTIRIFSSHYNQESTNGNRCPAIDQIEVHEITGYASASYGEIIDYLEKCTAYYNEELVIPDTALFFGSAMDYIHMEPSDYETDSISYILAQGYGEENLEVNNSFFATGQDILDYLQNGQKYYEIWSHSGANGHSLSSLDVGPRPEFYSYSEGKDLLGSGANINVVFACHGANFLDERDGCLAEQYIHTPISLVSTGVTRSELTYLNRDELFIDANEDDVSDDYFGTIYLNTKNFVYDDRQDYWLPYHDDPDDDKLNGPEKPVLSQIMLGNPFVLGLDTYSETPATISGTVSASATMPLSGVKVFAYISGKVMGYAYSDEDGTYTIPNLASGTYTLTAIAPHGDEESITSFSLTTGQDLTGKDFSFSLTKDLVDADDDWKYDYYPTGNWHTTGYDDSTWDEGKMPFNAYLQPPEIGTHKTGGELCIRKTFSVGTPANVHIYISADVGIDVFLNGIDYSGDTGVGTMDVLRTDEKYFNIHLDSSDFNSDITTGSNLIVVRLYGFGICDIKIWEDGTTVYTDQDMLSGDFTGNGYKDKLQIRSVNGFTFLNISEQTSGGFSTYETWATTDVYPQDASTWLSGDYTGDGIVDVLEIITAENNTYYKLFTSEGDIFTEDDWKVSNLSADSDQILFTHDFNNDGIMDIGQSEIDEGNNDVELSFSTGSEFCDANEAEHEDNYIGAWPHFTYMAKDYFSGDLGVQVKETGIIEIENVHTIVDGTHVLTIDWILIGYAYIRIYVNDSATPETTLYIPGSGILTQTTCDIDLIAGTNKIKIIGDLTPEDITPFIDKISIALKTGLPEDIYFVEAEDAYLKSGSSTADSDCSGGYKVIDVGPTGSDYLVTEVSGQTETGVHTCIIDYMASSDAELLLTNGSHNAQIIFPSTGGELSSVSFELNLAAGTNYIYFTGTGNGEIEMDCLRFIPRCTAATDDSVSVRYEAESALNVFEGDATVEQDGDFSGFAKVTDIGATSDDYLEINNIYASAAGDYLCTFVYTSDADEMLEVKVNTQSDKEVPFPDDSAGFDEVSILVSLSQGDNTIKIHQPSGSVDIELDYIEITPYEVLFSDDFESGDLANWTTAGTTEIYTGTPHNGSYGARLVYMANIQKTSLSTEDYSDIYFGFDLGAINLESADFVQVKWYDGSAWQVAAEIYNGDPEEQQAFTHYNCMLPVGAEDISDFRILVVVQAPYSGGDGYGYIDDVILAGKPVD